MNFPDLSRYPYFTMDFETTGLKFWSDKIFGVALSLPDGSDHYWDVRKYPKVIQWLKDSLPRIQLWVNHNNKYDALFARAAGVQVPTDRLGCTMIRAALIDEHRMTYDLNSVGNDCVGVGKDEHIWTELAALFGGKPTKDAQIANLQRAPESLAGRYAKRDTRTALTLWEWQEHQIREQDLTRVDMLERQLLAVIIDMEWGGVRVDVDKAEQAVQDINSLASKMQKKLDEVAGFPVNPNPSGSINKLFEPKLDDRGNWILIDGTIAEKTDGGKASINADVLRSMRHPAAAMILQLRKMIKTRDTFLKGHILGHHHRGIIHANYNQTKSENDRGTGTGRLSVNSPALQQIHARDVDIAAIVRAIFLPDEGQEWGCWDWSQMDFRMCAHYMNSPEVNKRYVDDPDSDFHQLAADLTGLPRKPRYAGDANAKQINLGLVFGMGSGKLAAEMGLPYTLETARGRTYMKPGPEAEAVFDRYHAGLPDVQKTLKKAASIAKDRGYVMTIMGRRIRFPRGQFTHKAGGLVFQGTAADALKQKLVEVHREIKNTDSRLLLNVHDEQDLSVPFGSDKLRDRVSEIITTFDGVNCPINFRVPIRCDSGFGPNWYEASK